MIDFKQPLCQKRFACMAFPTDQNYHSFPFYCLSIFFVLWHKQFTQKDTNANQTRAYQLRWWYRVGVTLLCRLWCCIYFAKSISALQLHSDILHQYVSVFWYRAMCGDDKRARFTLICVSYYRFAWGIQHIFYLQSRSAKTPAKSLYPYCNALYATL